MMNGHAFEVHEITSLRQLYNVCIDFAMKAIAANTPAPKIMAWLTGNLISVSREQLIDVMCVARTSYDQSIPIPRLQASFREMTDRSDEGFASACAGFITAAAYHRLGRLNEWHELTKEAMQAVADKHHVKAFTELPLEVISDILEIPEGTPIAIAVTRCEDMARPPIGSRVIECYWCPEQSLCWIAADTAKQFVEAQKAGRTVHTVCNRCLNSYIKSTEGQK